MRCEKTYRQEMEAFKACPEFLQIAQSCRVDEGDFLLLGVAPRGERTSYIVEHGVYESRVIGGFRPFENEYFYTTPRAWRKVTRMAGSSGYAEDGTFFRRFAWAQVYYVSKAANGFNLILFLDADDWLNGNAFYQAARRLAEIKDCFVLTERPELWYVKLPNAKGAWQQGLWVWRAVWAQRSDGSAFSVLSAVESGDTKIIPNLEVFKNGNYQHSLEGVSFLTTNLTRFAVDAKEKYLLHRCE